MTKRLIPITITMLLMVSMFAVTAVGANVVLTLSANSATVGTGITASGTADPDVWVSIKVLDSTQNIVFFDAVKSDASGEYSCIFKVPQVSTGDLTVVAGYGSNVANKTLVISGGGSDPVTPTLSSITITNPATKLVYTVGDKLDITGLVVTGTYSDGSTKEETITTANVTGFDSSKPVTKQVLTITVGGKIATYTVEIKAATTGSPGGNGGPGAAPAGQTISSSGGTVKEAGAVVSFPADAISSDIKVTVKKLSTGIPSVSSKFKLLGNVYEFTSNKSSKFKKPVTITLPFDRSKIDTDKYDVGIYCWHNNQWVILDQITVDIAAGKVSGTVNHFSKFAVLASEKAITPVDLEKEPIKEPTKPVLTDITGHWAETNISKLVAAGAISGYPDGTFKPDNTISRAEFATILVNAFKLAPKDGKVFNDTANHWAKKSIATAAANGIVNGYSDTAFGPNDNITREQMAVMITKAAKLTNVSGGKSFADEAQISDWAKEAVAGASGAGIISGYPDNTFRPGANATRGEAATVINKTLK